MHLLALKDNVQYVLPQFYHRIFWYVQKYYWSIRQSKEK